LQRLVIIVAYKQTFDNSNLLTSRYIFSYSSFHVMYIRMIQV